MSETKSKPEIVKVTLRYNLRSSLSAPNGNNLYSTLECGLDLDVKVTPGMDVRSLIKTNFGVLGETLRDTLKKEAAKLQLHATILPENTVVAIAPDNFKED